MNEELEKLKKENAHLRKELEKYRSCGESESERRLRAVFDHTFQFIGLLEPNGNVILINHSALDFAGITNDDVKGRPFWETPWWAGLPTDVSLLRQAIERAGKGEFIRFQTVNKAKDGSRRTIDFSLVPVRDDNGKVIYLLPEGRDITVLRQVQTALQEALNEGHQRYRTLFNSAAEAIMTIRDGCIVDCNPRTWELLGRDKSELIGADILELSPLKQIFGEESSLALKQIFEMIKTDNIVEREWSFLRPDGKTVHTEIRLNALEIAGHPHVLALVRDISKRRELEARLNQIQKLRTVGQLAGGVAHDLNNLLVPIIGYVQLLMTNHPGFGQMELQTILDAALKAKNLVGQLLAFSRKSILAMRAENIVNIVKSLQSIVRRSISEDIDIRYRLPDAAPPVNCDRSMVEQVLMNLLVNARDAVVSKGEILIFVEQRSIDEDNVDSVVPPGDYVILGVRDNGAGMDEKTQAQIFEPFFTTKKRSEGTGLGLSTVFGVMKQHHGGVEVKSRPGRGTTMLLYFPTMKEAFKQEPVRPATLIKHSLPVTEHVLVVEDDSQVRKFVTTALKGLGYKVTTVGGGRECLDLLHHRDAVLPDLLLVDVIMPEMNGRELVEMLRRDFPLLPVLYMSGYTNKIIARKGCLEPGTNLLAKPFTLDELTRAVRSALDGACGRVP